MKYYNLSKNIIACDDFLPQQKIDELYSDILNNRQIFNIPNWTKGKELFSSKCGGLDFWLENKTKKTMIIFLKVFTNGFCIKVCFIM